MLDCVFCNYRIQTRLRLKKDGKEDCVPGCEYTPSGCGGDADCKYDCHPGCADCTKCMYFLPLAFICFPICKAANCEGKENPWFCK